MNIIKRDGSQAVFDASKIAAAIRKANATVGEADRPISVCCTVRPEDGSCSLQENHG